MGGAARGFGAQPPAAITSLPLARDAALYWVETPSKLPEGSPQVYYYNLSSKEVSWTRPTDPLLIVVSHAELLALTRGGEK